MLGIRLMTIKKLKKQDLFQSGETTDLQKKTENRLNIPTV